MSEEGYDSVMSRLQQSPLRQALRAVHFTKTAHFSRQGYWRGTGTLILNGAGQHSMIVTAAHLFSIDSRPEYTRYRVLQPWTKVDHAIESAHGGVMDNGDPPKEADIAICKPGELRKIPGFSPHPGGDWQGPRDMTCVKEEYPPGTSLLTGEVAPVIGSVHSAQWGKFFIMQYRSYPGESGTGFLKAEDELYVLTSGVQVTPRMRDTFEIPSSFPIISYAAAVKISW